MGITPKIAMLDLAPGISVGQLRHDGFLKGFGIKEGDPQIVGAAPTLGDQAKGQAAMETLLQKDPDINVIYSINEPSGFGGATALKAAGKDPKDFILVSVDGGCKAIKDGIKPGIIDATSQQYPLKMAALGVEKGAAAARGGEKPSGYTDTGVELITAGPGRRRGLQGRGLRRGELLGLMRPTAGPHPRAGRLRSSRQRGPIHDSATSTDRGRGRRGRRAVRARPTTRAAAAARSRRSPVIASRSSAR